jgi:phage-related protein
MTLRTLNGDGLKQFFADCVNARKINVRLTQSVSQHQISQVNLFHDELPVEN